MVRNTMNGSVKRPRLSCRRYSTTGRWESIMIFPNDYSGWTEWSGPVTQISMFGWSGMVGHFSAGNWTAAWAWRFDGCRKWSKTTTSGPLESRVAVIIFAALSIIYSLLQNDIIQTCVVSSGMDCRRLLQAELLFQVLPDNHGKFVFAGAG